MSCLPLAPWPRFTQLFFLLFIASATYSKYELWQIHCETWQVMLSLTTFWLNQWLQLRGSYFHFVTKWHILKPLLFTLWKVSDRKTIHSKEKRFCYFLPPDVKSRRTYTARANKYFRAKQILAPGLPLARSAMLHLSTWTNNLSIWWNNLWVIAIDQQPDQPPKGTLRYNFVL